MNGASCNYKEKDRTKPGTVNEYLSNLRNMLDKAVEEELLDKNPHRGIKKRQVVQLRYRRNRVVIRHTSRP
ncbi:MAG: phage integrase SAM-like domain-containing protein [Candidatus Brocadia sp.]